MDTSCIFCKIASGAFGTAFVHEDDSIVAFEDLNPQAPHHVLIIPREHVVSLSSASDDHDALLSRLLRVAVKVAAERGIAESGYRTVINTGPDGGQSVFHLHLHLLGGRPLAWPPG